MDEHNLETFSLVWLDTSVDSFQEKIHIQQQLRTVINHLKTFNDENQCEQYIRSVSTDDRIVLIVSGQLGRQLVPRIHQLRQLSSIYVICVDRKKHQTWTNEYTKIKCLVTQYDELVSQIGYDQTQRNENQIDEPLSISIFNEKTNDEESVSLIDNQFVYSQLFINSLLTIKSNSKDKKQLIHLCQNEYRGNESQLAIIDEFEKEYSSDRALWWYTRDSFLSRIINKALRIKDFDLLFLFRFFISDIEEQLKQHQCLKSIRVYRSQVLSNEEIKLFKDHIGKPLSINSFLSTNIFRKSSLSNLKQFYITDDFQRVLFEIDLDPRCNSIRPLANITSLTYLKNEQQIFIMFGSIFRIIDIHYDDAQFWIIQLKLCNHNEQELKPIRNLILTKQNEEELDFLSFGHILLDIGKFNQAEKYFLRLLDQLPDNHIDIDNCYVALANISTEKGQYDSSLKWHKKSLEIKMRHFDPNDPILASSYNSIAFVHLKKNSFKQALESYEMALSIFQKRFNEDDPHIQACFNNIAMVYKCEKKYLESLNFYQKTLTIHQKYLSEDHPDLALSYTNIGIVYGHLGQYDLASEHYNRALEIYERILPCEHILISMTLENLGNICYDKGEFHQGLLYYQKSALIYRRLLPSTHPDVLQIEMAIRRITSKLKYI